MGIELPHKKVKLVIPVLFSGDTALSRAEEVITGQFGDVDYRSESFPFTYTDYYANEMGTSIKRIFFAFKCLIEVNDLILIKKETNKIESGLSENNKRPVNLDPGYLELGKFVLATTKDQQHRLYMGGGIYEEITLYFKDREWRHWDWTYPDYRSRTYKEILLKIREIYKAQLNAKPEDSF